MLQTAEIKREHVSKDEIIRKYSCKNHPVFHIPDGQKHAMTLKILPGKKLKSDEYFQDLRESKVFSGMLLPPCREERKPTHGSIVIKSTI